MAILKINIKMLLVVVVRATKVAWLETMKRIHYIMQNSTVNNTTVRRQRQPTVRDALCVRRNAALIRRAPVSRTLRDENFPLIAENPSHEQYLSPMK